MLDLRPVLHGLEELGLEGELALLRRLHQVGGPEERAVQTAAVDCVFV